VKDTPASLPLDRFGHCPEALEGPPEDIKVVLHFIEAA
jgi:hypothetical protein